MLKPERHTWEEGSIPRAVGGTEYDKVWDYADALEAENKMLKEKHHPDCNVLIPISQDMPEPPYCTCGYGHLEAQVASLREALFQHRADMHQSSRRPCDTCRNSAKALGLTGLVPSGCARWDIKERELVSNE